MIIVSQDKHLLNYNNVVDIYKTIGTEKNVRIEATTANDDYVDLGEYDTEERADEVLEEIIRKLEDADIVNLMENLQIALHDPKFGGSLASVYRMPKE